MSLGWYLCRAVLLFLVICLCDEPSPLAAGHLLSPSQPLSSVWQTAPALVIGIVAFPTMRPGPDPTTRCKSTGTIQEYPLPTTNSIPDGITVGPDGKLWFTEVHENQRGSSTIGGMIREHPLPTTTEGRSGIRCGRDVPIQTGTPSRLPSIPNL